MRCIGSAIVGLLLATAAHAAGIAPCSSGSGTETVRPVKNSVMTYCVSDFGWSDTWFFSGSITTYTQSLDVLSGDDAPNLHYTGGTHGNDAGGWLSPSIDRGTRVPQTTGSTWQIITSVHLVGADPSHAQSVIQNGDGLRITIDTVVSGITVSLTFNFFNNGSSTLSNLLFADYFNYHPNGSTSTLTGNGVTLYADGHIYTNGNTTLASFIRNGEVFGQRLDDKHRVGYASCSLPCIPVWQQVQNQSYDGSTGPIGQGDTAGALAWNLVSTFAPGASTSFTITKEFVAPEPAAWQLMIAGGLLIGFRQFRRRRVKRN